MLLLKIFRTSVPEKGLINIYISSPGGQHLGGSESKQVTGSGAGVRQVEFYLIWLPKLSRLSDNLSAT